MIDLMFTFPYLLISLVFLNRYFFGAFLKGARGSRVGRAFTSAQPSVGIVIPLFNEGASIYDTLKSLAVQDYPSELLTIYVVDDCSKDDSFAWASKAASEHPNITVMRNPHNMGKRLGIARAVAIIDCEVVVSIDSDVVVAPDAVRQLVKYFTSDDIAAVGGRVNVINCNVNWLTKMQTIKYFFGYEYLKNLENSYQSVMCLSGCLTAYRRHVLIELEDVLVARNLFGVPIKYGEDRFLTRQIIKAGYKTQLTFDAQCYTKAPHTLKGYFAQQLRWRRSNLVDFVGGITHVWRQHPVVALHYLSLYSLLVCYPVFLWSAVAAGNLMPSIVLHIGVLAVFSVIYLYETRKYPEALKVHPIHFLWMSFVMPVTYMVLTVLAVFTLDSGSWETRQAGEALKAKPIQ